MDAVKVVRVSARVAPQVVAREAAVDKGTAVPTDVTSGTPLKRRPTQISQSYQ